MKILDLGCGRRKTKGAMGVDINPSSAADIIHDLNKFPYPFSNDEFDLIICNSILEHLDDIIKVMEEIHRIARTSALIKVITPHFSSTDSFRDLTHKHPFSIHSFDVSFGQTETRFKLIKARIIFGRLYRFMGIEFLANTFPSFYESHLAFIFQAHKLHLELKVLK